jgi:uncharacterized membrane protein (UPF0127 family)
MNWFVLRILGVAWCSAARHLRPAQCRPRRLNVGSGIARGYLVGRIFASLLFAVALVGCDRAPDSSLPITRMQIGAQTFNLEIASSSHDQRVGLMHREHLDADHGMIFPLPDEQVQMFWNHDVHFPLDVVFLNDRGDIVSIVRLEAFNDRGMSSNVPALYAIELNAGTAARLNLKVGDHLDVPKEALEASAK